MSDLSIYELDDIIWDDLECNIDHFSEDKREGDSCKKPRREVTHLQSNDGNLYASCSVSQERDTKTLNKEINVTEKDPGFHTRDGDADSAKDMPRHIPQSDDRNLFSNDDDGKESNDLLYYGWPDIENFDDVDGMLSNCDSSFGIGITGNDDALVWFTSEDPVTEYVESSKTDLNFPCSEPSALTNISHDHEPRESDNKNLRHNSVIQSHDYPHLVHDNVPMQPTRDPLMTRIKSENKGPTFSTELDSLNVLEGSSISSELDEVSLEASSFLQLQQVMEQLDLRTKLCIRDSLYRLARSAEQRHNYIGMSDSTTNCVATGGPLMTEGANKYTGLVDMETDTNPIDRTIAHLLFHRPSDSSNRPTPLPLKPNAKVHGSTSRPSTVAEKLSYQEVENDESYDKISSTGKN